jgi:hypothetical protein
VRAFAVLNVCLAGVWLLLAYRAGKMHDELVAKSDIATTNETAA